MSSTKKTILFLGSKPIGYQCLEYLLSVQDSLNALIIGVLTQARKEFRGGHDLVTLSAAHGIPIIRSLEELPACDIIYSVQYHEILEQKHINQASQIAVNLHMAPLPEYRGCNQFSFAIIDRKAEFGATLHQIDTRIDHGDILAEKRFSIPEYCWVDELYELTSKASLELFKESLEMLIASQYTPIPQDELVPNRGTSTHYRKDIVALKQIDLTWPADRIDRHIRATSMPGFEPPYTILGDRKIYFTT